MYRFFLLFFLFAISLYALSNNSILKRADNLIKSSNSSNQFRAYNDYKNLYLRSMMSNDDKLKYKSLQGIVKSGKKLHIDIAQYQNELYAIKKSNYHPPKSKSNKKTNKKIKVSKSHKLKSIKWDGDRLIVEFDKKLKQKQINYFTLYDSKKKVYKYVFDIHASMLNKSKSLRKKGIKRVKLGQYNPTTLRLVIENNSKLKVRFKKDSSKLIVNVDITSKKETKSKTKIKNKNITPPKRVDRDKIIVIDPGHGGKDPGAVGYKKYREKIIVMQIAKNVQSYLKKRGYKVYMTRGNDKFVKLSNRTKYANKKNADIFISIHANAAKSKKANGIECYFLSKSRSSRASRVAAKENSADISAMNKYGKKSFLNFLNHHKILASNKLAIDLQRGMLGSLNKNYKNVRDGGVREGPFWVLVGAQMPAVLVEVGFISNTKEAKRLVNTKYQKRLSIGIADGIERYFANN